MDHDHSLATHSADCDEAGCAYVAHVHAHDDDMAAQMLAQDLAIHNKNEHGKDTAFEEIIIAVKAKTKRLN